MDTDAGGRQSVIAAHFSTKDTTHQRRHGDTTAPVWADSDSRGGPYAATRRGNSSEYSHLADVSEIHPV